MIQITNGKIVTPTGVMEGFDLFIANGLIKDILPAEVHGYSSSEIDEVINADGAFITPGFIDIHADYIEHMAAPRPTSLIDFRLSLHEAERELITHGITTMFHSLSFFKDTVFDTKPIRNPENIRKMIQLIDDANSGKEHYLINHRFHARYEIDNLDMTEELKSYITDGKIHLLSFMDHTPGQGQYRDLEIFRHTLKGYRGDMSDADITAAMERAQKTPKLSLKEIEEISRLAHSKGIALASHDDDTIEKINLVKSFNTEISEFPITLEVAQYARKQGMDAVAGAPNILLGGSHSGNLSACEAILHDAVNILCSDYYPASLLHALFYMHEKNAIPLHTMVNMVTLNPAKAVQIDHQLGSISRGKIADLLFIQKIDNAIPVVSRAIVKGNPVFHTNYNVSPLKNVQENPKVEEALR